MNFATETLAAVRRLANEASTVATWCRRHPRRARREGENLKRKVGSWEEGFPRQAMRVIARFAKYTALAHRARQRPDFPEVQVSAAIDQTISAVDEIQRISHFDLHEVFDSMLLAYVEHVGPL